MVSCEALTIRGESCRLAVAYVVEVPESGPQHLCGAHARTVRMRGALPDPPAPKPPRQPKQPRVLVQPTWSAEEDALLLAHAGEPVRTVASLFPRRTVSAIYQRRATLRRAERRLRT